MHVDSLFNLQSRHHLLLNTGLTIEASQSVFYPGCKKGYPVSSRCNTLFCPERTRTAKRSDSYFQFFMRFLDNGNMYLQ